MNRPGSRSSSRGSEVRLEAVEQVGERAVERRRGRSRRRLESREV